MQPSRLLLRCYAERCPGYWAAYCLDLTLYAVGRTRGEARRKLDLIIEDYVAEATWGRDAAYRDQLIPRRAPWWAWARYYRRRLWGWCGPRSVGSEAAWIIRPSRPSSPAP